MRSLIKVLFISISFLLSSCDKKETSDITPVPEIIDFSGTYKGTFYVIESYPNNPDKTPRTTSEGDNTRVIKNDGVGFYLYDAGLDKKLYFNTNKSISYGRSTSQGSILTGIDRKWNILGDSLLGTEGFVLHYTDPSQSINDTKSTGTYKLKLVK